MRETPIAPQDVSCFAGRLRDCWRFPAQLTNLSTAASSVSSAASQFVCLPTSLLSVLPAVVLLLLLLRLMPGTLRCWLLADLPRVPAGGHVHRVPATVLCWRVFCWCAFCVTQVRSQQQADRHCSSLGHTAVLADSSRWGGRDMRVGGGRQGAEGVAVAFISWWL